MLSGTLHSMIPDPELLKRMRPPELAEYLLAAMIDAGAENQSQRHRVAFVQRIVEEYRADRRDPVDATLAMAIAEAWSWLECNQLIVKHPTGDGDWYVVTARGDTVWKSGGMRRFVESRQLPESMLHPSLRGRVRLLFLSGDFDTAVFKAFHELEVSIRESAQLGAGLTGRALVHAAFKPKVGRLADHDQEEGEQESMMFLMSGAIGYCKNPQSHRRVGLDANTARELLVLASHLIGIVDSRRKD